ncbi:MAG: hypothetical protein H6849_03185 [Alphaproteobacteria bacterium]|nr:MAG: hypothetical protein H6849_03185 [Alphaproteobacteria bacterium]
MRTIATLSVFFLIFSPLLSVGAREQPSSDLPKQQEYLALLAEVGYENTDELEFTASSSNAKGNHTTPGPESLSEAKIARLEANSKALQEFLASVGTRMEKENKETRDNLKKVHDENKKMNEELHQKIASLDDKEKAIEARQVKLEKAVTTQLQSTTEGGSAPEVTRKHKDSLEKIKKEYALKSKAIEEREKAFLEKQQRDMRQEIERAVADLKKQLASNYESQLAKSKMSCEKKIKKAVEEARKAEKLTCHEKVIPAAIKETVSKKEALRTQAEVEEKLKISEQKRQGMVLYGNFKGVRKESECISRYRLHFWSCKSKNDSGCWKQLFKEFHNCLKVTVPEGKEYNTESTKILAKEKSHAQ